MNQHCQLRNLLAKYGMMWNVDSRTIKNRTEELLSSFELTEDIRKKRTWKIYLSVREEGFRFAREFMHDMELLFLDEPTVGLDPSARRKLLDFLKNKIKETGLTIFYTTHVLTEAEYLCDNIAIINKGKIITVAFSKRTQKKIWT